MEEQKGKMKRNRNLFLLSSEALNYIILFLLIALVLEPEGVTKVVPLLGNLVWSFYSRLLSASILSIAFVLVTIKRRKMDVAVLCILAYVVAAGMISILKLHTLEGWFSRYLCIISSTFLVVIYRQDLPRLTRTVAIYLKILIAFNFILVLLCPEGLYEGEVYKKYNWLLGYKSSLQYYVFPAITFSWLDAAYSQKKKKTVEFLVLFGLCIAEAALSRNAMLLIGLSLEAICIVLHVENRTTMLNGFTYFLASFIFNVVILFFVQVVLKMPLVLAILTSLGKNLTFSGRINVGWPHAISAILKSPVWGYGVLTSVENSWMLGNGNLAYAHAHNHLLQIFLDGGIFLFGIYLLFVAVIVYRMMRSKELKSTQILGMSIFILLIMSTVEIFTRNSGTGMWLIFLLCAKTKELDHQFLQKIFKNKKIRVEDL